MPQDEPLSVYLTFDDGPHPEITPYVLEQLKEYDAKASFFCIGKNVGLYPEVLERIREEGHTLGNHTQNHFNGWKTEDSVYIENIDAAAGLLPTRNFRPPYGRIRRSQARQLLSGDRPWRIYMWDIISGDFDRELTPEACLDNVIRHLRPGSIVVFHDSEKAFPRLRHALPGTLDHCRKMGWELKALPQYL